MFLGDVIGAKIEGKKQRLNVVSRMGTGIM